MRTALAIVAIGGGTWAGLWFTPPQQGQRLMDRGEFAAAAETFRDPMRQGTAWFRAGEFAQAEQAFSRCATKASEFNRGNCLVMQGKYQEAVERYDRALELQPGFEDAEVNRAIALARAKRVARTGGDMGDQKLGADEITFDKQQEGGQETATEVGQPLSDAEVQALWLRRVQTQPADFLRAKFAYQLSQRDASETTP